RLKKTDETTEFLRANPPDEIRLATAMQGIRRGQNPSREPRIASAMAAVSGGHAGVARLPGGSVYREKENQNRTTGCFSNDETSDRSFAIVDYHSIRNGYIQREDSLLNITYYAHSTCCTYYAYSSSFSRSSPH